MPTYAVIQADPNSAELGEIVSTHRTLLGAGKSWHSLEDSRFAYIAEQKPDGSYAPRVDAIELEAHNKAIEMASEETARGR